MSPQLLKRLTARARDLPPEHRKQAEGQMELIHRAGIVSLKDLMAAVENPAIEKAIRLAGCQLLGLLQDPRAAASLLNTFRGAEDKELVWETAKVLSRLRRTSAALSLVDFVRSPDRSKATAATWALGWLGDARAIPALRAAAMDRDLDLDVRAHAVEALGVMRAKEAVPDLLVSLHDELPEIRYWAAYSLGAIGDPSALPELERVVEADHAVVAGWGSISAEAREAVDIINGREPQIE